MITTESWTTTDRENCLYNALFCCCCCISHSHKSLSMQLLLPEVLPSLPHHEKSIVQLLYLATCLLWAQTKNQRRKKPFKFLPTQHITADSQPNHFDAPQLPTPDLAESQPMADMADNKTDVSEVQGWGLLRETLFSQPEYALKVLCVAFTCNRGCPSFEVTVAM